MRRFFCTDFSPADPALTVESEALNGQPSFEQILDDLARFLADRAVLAQDAQLTWEFLRAEARRARTILVTPALIDVNDLAIRQLELKGKPTLALVAMSISAPRKLILAP